MNQAETIAGKWLRKEKIGEMTTREEYIFYTSGICQFVIKDNCGGIEEHKFNYSIDKDKIDLVEEVVKGVLIFPFVIDGNHLMIKQKEIAKIYTKTSDIQRIDEWQEPIHTRSFGPDALLHPPRNEGQAGEL